MDKATWISEASRHLQDPSVAGWTPEISDEYAVSVFEIRSIDWPDDPAGAVDDDLSYRDTTS